MCSFCKRELIIGNDGSYYPYENETEIVSGNWTTLYIGIDENERIYLNAQGDGYTDNYYPKFCPECGRDLRRTDE